MNLPPEAIRGFVAALTPPLATQAGEQLGERLNALFARATEPWPRVALPAGVFLPYLAQRLAGDDLEAALTQVRASDLYLACACAARDEEALRAFETSYFAEADRAIERFRADGLGGDLRQVIREKLFVAAPGATAKIADYSGRGDLRNWLRVACVRTLLNLLARGPREELTSSESLYKVAGGAHDPELEYLKRKYRREFQVAFAAAIAELSVRDRNLLRHGFLDGLSIDEIGAAYGVHRATAARWLGAARLRLLARVRQALTERLHISEDEFDSIIRLVQSNLEITLEGLRSS